MEYRGLKTRERFPCCGFYSIFLLRTKEVYYNWPRILTISLFDGLISQIYASKNLSGKNMFLKRIFFDFFSKKKINKNAFLYLYWACVNKLGLEFQFSKLMLPVVADSEFGTIRIVYTLVSFINTYFCFIAFSVFIRRNIAVLYFWTMYTHFMYTYIEPKAANRRIRKNCFKWV